MINHKAEENLMDDKRTKTMKFIGCVYKDKQVFFIQNYKLSNRKKLFSIIYLIVVKKHKKVKSQGRKSISKNVTTCFDNEQP